MSEFIVSSKSFLNKDILEFVSNMEDISLVSKFSNIYRVIEEHDPYLPKKKLAVLQNKLILIKYDGKKAIIPCTSNTEAENIKKMIDNAHASNKYAAISSGKQIILQIPKTSILYILSTAGCRSFLQKYEKVKDEKVKDEKVKFVTYFSVPRRSNIIFLTSFLNRRMKENYFNEITRNFSKKTHYYGKDIYIPLYSEDLDPRLMEFIINTAREKQKLTYVIVLLLDSYFKMKKKKECPFCFFSNHALRSALSKHTGFNFDSLKQYLNSSKPNYIMKLIDTIENSKSITSGSNYEHRCDKHYSDNNNTGTSLVNKLGDMSDYL